MRIIDAQFATSASNITECPNPDVAEIAFLGRSNVGKSSFINTLVNRKNLARTSAKPGKTQTLNFYNIDDLCYLVDVPGYGYAAVSNKKQEKFGLMIEEYIMNRPNLKHVFLLVDYRHKPTDNDLIMYDFLKYYNLPVTVVCTKYDKIKKSQKEKQNKLIENTIDLALGDEIIYFSKITKVGRDKIIKVMESKLD